MSHLEGSQLLCMKKETFLHVDLESTACNLYPAPAGLAIAWMGCGAYENRGPLFQKLFGISRQRQQNFQLSNHANQLARSCRGSRGQEAKGCDWSTEGPEQDCILCLV